MEKEKPNAMLNFVESMQEEIDGAFFKKDLERIVKYLENLTNVYRFEAKQNKPDKESIQLIGKITINRITEILEKHGTAK